jgi:hypothetical protein
MSEYLLCSNCFLDQGLKLNAFKIGREDDAMCINCKSTDGRKLDRDLLENLTHIFFVTGSIQKANYGSFPLLEFNEYHYNKTDIKISEWLENDLKLIENSLLVGFFYYGPRLWMIGEIEPLKSLQNESEKKLIIKRIMTEYPVKLISEADLLYRLRINPEYPEKHEQYDSAPFEYLGVNRLDTPSLPILYASQDLEVCIHECRATVEDNLYVATLQSTRELKLLDLSIILDEEEVTEFESLDIAINMLFSAGKHSYEICRSIAEAAAEAGFDGIIYPSYFSSLRTGIMSLRTIYGMSIRRMKQFRSYAKSHVIENIALFDRPVKNKTVHVKCINKIILNRVEYDVQFGPILMQPEY